MRLLDFHEHQRFEHASLQRFPQERDGSIAWASVPRTLIVCAEQDTEQPIRRFLQQDDELVIMWGSISLPSVLLNAVEASARVSEILATDVLLWFYRPGHRLFLERNYVEDTAVVARIPGD